MAPVSSSAQPGQARAVQLTIPRVAVGAVILPNYTKPLSVSLVELQIHRQGARTGPPLSLGDVRPPPLPVLPPFPVLLQPELLARKDLVAPYLR